MGPFAAGVVMLCALTTVISFPSYFLLPSLPLLQDRLFLIEILNYVCFTRKSRVMLTPAYLKSRDRLRSRMSGTQEEGCAKEVDTMQLSLTWEQLAEKRILLSSRDSEDASWNSLQSTRVCGSPILGSIQAREVADIHRQILKRQVRTNSTRRDDTSRQL